jgi:ATP/maltotriose-dependent transcriptional regulator MalT
VAGASSVWGPTPVEEALGTIQRHRMELEEVGAGGGSAIARLELFRGRFDDASRELDESERAFRELGDRFLIAEAESIRGEIAFAKGDLEMALQHIRAGYDGKIALGDRAYASTTAGVLAQAHLEAGNAAEAMRFATIAVDTSASDDIASQGTGRAVQARVLSQSGDRDTAINRAREAMDIFGKTDYLTMHATALVHVAHVLHESGKDGEALSTAREAEQLYARKGATFFEEKTRQLIESWSR